jgi:hypothetical protein
MRIGRVANLKHAIASMPSRQAGGLKTVYERREQKIHSMVPYLIYF